jgi:hypothetical protein
MIGTVLSGTLAYATFMKKTYVRYGTCGVVNLAIGSFSFAVSFIMFVGYTEFKQLDVATRL